MLKSLEDRVRVRLSGLINGRNQIPLLGISSSVPFWSESVLNTNTIFPLQTGGGGGEYPLVEVTVNSKEEAS